MRCLRIISWCSIIFLAGKNEVPQSIPISRCRSSSPVAQSFPAACRWVWCPIHRLHSHWDYVREFYPKPPFRSQTWFLQKKSSHEVLLCFINILSTSLISVAFRKWGSKAQFRLHLVDLSWFVAVLPQTAYFVLSAIRKLFYDYNIFYLICRDALKTGCLGYNLPFPG